MRKHSGKDSGIVTDSAPNGNSIIGAECVSIPAGIPESLPIPLRTGIRSLERNA